MKAANVDLVVTHPKGYDLAPEFMKGVHYEPDQKKAFEGADFIYAKNWSSYTEYGKILSQDRSWTVDEAKMALTNEAKFMHCLPVRRNMIVTDGVIDSPQSIVIEEAANRVVSMQVVLKRMLQNIAEDEDF
jgi:N-succinyl-L-ornithine transcarbamylase